MFGSPANPSLEHPDAAVQASQLARRIATARRSLRIVSPAVAALLFVPMAAQAASSDPPTHSAGTHSVSSTRASGSATSAGGHAKQSTEKKKAQKRHRVTTSFRAVAGEATATSASSVAGSAVALPVLTITVTSVTSTYGDAPVTYTVKVDGLKAGDSVPTATQGLRLAGPEPDADAGTYDIVASGARVPSGYSGIRYVNGKHTIAKAELALVVKDLTTTYGQTPPAFDVRYYGLRNGDTAPAKVSAPVVVVPGTYLPHLTADAKTAAGTYQVSAVAEDANYYMTVTTGTWTVGKAPLLVGAGIQTMTWGDAVPTFRSAAVGLVNGETVADLTPIKVSGPASPDAGSYPLVPTGGTSPNYVTTYVPGQLVVAKRPVWISADDKTRVFGSANPTFTATVTGMPAGRTLGVSFKAVPAGLNPGSYPITPIAPANTNVDVKELRAGTLTTTPAPLTISPVSRAIASGTLPNPNDWKAYGWLTGQNDSSMLTRPTCTATVDGATVSTTTKPGVYQDAITCSGAVLPVGYAAVYGKATLTINPLMTLKATGLPTYAASKATVDGVQVSLPRTNVMVAFGSEHSYSFPGVVTGTGGKLYITTAAAFSGPVSDNVAVTAPYATMGQLVSNAVSAGQVNAAVGRSLVQAWSDAEFGLANDYQVREGLAAFADQVRSTNAQQLAPEAAKTLLDHARAVWAYAGLDGEL